MHNAAAFIPFSYGPTSCAGKLLAMQEMRTVICHLMQNFDVRVPEGRDLRRAWEDSIEDKFVLKLGELPAVLEKRC